MVKVSRTSQNTNSWVRPTRNKLNASTGLSDETEKVLNQISQQLKQISGQLGALIEDQVTDPTYVEGKGVAADRLLDWTADIFSISEDMKFYLNPELES